MEPQFQPLDIYLRLDQLVEDHIWIYAGGKQHLVDTIIRLNTGDSIENR